MPKALRDTFQGRVEIKHSLRTRDLREALLQARQLSLAAYELFAMVKRTMVRPFDPNDLSTWPTAGDVAGKFEMTVEEDIATGKRITRIKTDPDSPASVAAGKEVALCSKVRVGHTAKYSLIRNNASPTAVAILRFLFCLDEGSVQCLRIDIQDTIPDASCTSTTMRRVFSGTVRTNLRR